MIDINECFTYAYSAGTEADFAQTVSADAQSTNILDLGASAIKLSGGAKATYFILKSYEAASGAGTIEFQLRNTTAADATTGRKDIWIGRYTNAQMTAGALLACFMLPVAEYQQYLSVYFNIYTTTGKFIAYLSPDPESAETALDLTEAGS